MSLFDELQRLDARQLAKVLEEVLVKANDQAETEEMVAHSALNFPTYTALLEHFYSIANSQFDP